MTKLLEQAFQKASKLPKGEQDAMAAFMLGELESEKHWDTLFVGSQDWLREMAAEAIQEVKQ
jgi:putative sterol carrier protein